MGRKHSTTLRGKFPHITYASGDVVYVAELTNGVIKVGVTGNARSRMTLMQTEARRLFCDVSISRFHITHPHDSRLAARRAEEITLAQVRQIAAPASDHGTEYFTGVAFDRVVSIADEAAAELHDALSFAPDQPLMQAVIR